MAFLQLSRPTLLKLATALENGRLSPPFLVSTIAKYVTATLSQTVVDELNHLTCEGVKCSHIAFSEASDASPFLQKVKNSEGIHLAPNLRGSGKEFHS